MTEKKNARPAADKHGIAGLAARLGRLSSEKKRAALETSAALAGVSLRVSRDFVESVPKAAKLLSAEPAIMVVGPPLTDKGAGGGKG